MSNCYPIITPMEKGVRIQSNVESKEFDKIEYQCRIGSLIYYSLTRPN